jgi:hypothetical protein
MIYKTFVPDRGMQTADEQSLEGRLGETPPPARRTMQRNRSDGCLAVRLARDAGVNIWNDDTLTKFLRGFYADRAGADKLITQVVDLARHNFHKAGYGKPERAQPYVNAYVAQAKGLLSVSDIVLAFKCLNMTNWYARLVPSIRNMYLFFWGEAPERAVAYAKRLICGAIRDGKVEELASQGKQKRIQAYVDKPLGRKITPTQPPPETAATQPF